MLNIDKKKKYLLACSYGPDSMALFKMLLLEGYQFSVAHVNYHLRQESDLEMDSLSKYCKDNKIELFVLNVSEKINKNIEERCREIRYQFFADILLKHQEIDSVLVAHHQDDLIETYLLQKKRKIIPSYYGLKMESRIFGINIMRPLLNYKKSDLMEFCKENDVSYSIDITNLGDHFSRNIIRHQIVMKMDDEQRKKMLEEIEKENQKLLSYYESANKLVNLSNKDLLKLNPVVFRIYINKLAKEVFPNIEISNKVANQIRNVLSSSKPNVMTPINKDVVFYKEYETCFFDLDINENGYFYVLEKPQILDTPYFYLDFTSHSDNRNVNEQSYPIIIRNAHLEDLVPINNYLVKVRRLFIDWKMPLSLRKRWPIILNKDNEVLYIPRYQKDFVVDEKCNFYVKKRFSLKK